MKQERSKARIVGLGSYLPERILSNQDLEKIVETSDEWIYTRTGMRERRIAAQEEACSDMGFAAASIALKNSSINVEEIDLILVATMSPDYLTPSTAALIQARLGAKNASALDIQAACSGFLYGLSIAKAFIESGLYKKILLIASEKMSTYVDYTDRSTCVLFGDGAGAAMIQGSGAGFLIDTVSLGADGGLSDLVLVPGGGSRHPPSIEMIQQRLHYIKMAGKEVFKHAVRRMSSAASACLEKMGLIDEQISWLVPHQANERIIDAIAKNFNIPSERVFKTVEKYGNTSASSIVIALHELVQEQPINEQDHLLLIAFGAGLTWGAALLTFTHSS